MDRAIFDMNLGLEATSLYILICALCDQGETPTMDRIRVQWNGSIEKLLEAAEELVHHGIADGSLPIRENEPLHINPREKWHKS